MVRAADDAPAPDHRLPGTRPMIVSHRANMKVDPENTVAGIRHAIAQCVDAVEVDVQATADGIAVLVHDCSLRRVAGDPRTVDQLTSTEADRLLVQPPRAGSDPHPLARLAAALEAAAGRAVLVLDVKMSGIAEIVAAEVRQYGAHTTVHVQCDFDEAEQYRRLLPDIPITVGLRAGQIREHGLIPLLDRCQRLGLFGVSIRNRLLDRCAVEEAHARGLFVKTWTVDREPDLERVFEAGVDAVCGNDPDLMRRVRERVAG